MDWTTKQDELLFENANMGAEWCARELFRQFGVRRSASAVQRHGARIGVSFRRFEYCPECGRPMAHISKRLGVCRDCNARMHRDLAKERFERAEANFMTDGKNPEFERLVRENAMYRQRAHRAKRMSKQMSSSRSDTENETENEWRKN